jgi:NitT/TauT family transport system substrate-binding protein
MMHRTKPARRTLVRLPLRPARWLAVLLCPPLLCLPLLWGALPAMAQDVELVRLRVALPEGPSPRTLGYHLAEVEGAFAQVGLDPIFVPADDRGPIAMLADGDVDLAIDIMPHALAAREAGAQLLHVAQVFQRSGLLLACKRPIEQPNDLRGANVELWFDGQEGPFFAWMHKIGLGIYGEVDGVTILREAHEAAPYRGRRIDCFTTENYLLPAQLATEGKTQSDYHLFGFEELGTATLEDGLYARTEDLADPDRVDLFARFLAGTRAGWRSMADEPRKATERLVELMHQPEPDLPTLIRGVWAVNDLVDIDDLDFGRLNPAAYDRTVTVLLTGAPSPTLQTAPLGAISEIVLKKLKPE